MYLDLAGLSTNPALPSGVVDLEVQTAVPANNGEYRDTLSPENP